MKYYTVNMRLDYVIIRQIDGNVKVFNEFGLELNLNAQNMVEIRFWMKSAWNYT